MRAISHMEHQCFTCLYKNAGQVQVMQATFLGNTRERERLGNLWTSGGREGVIEGAHKSRNERSLL